MLLGFKRQFAPFVLDGSKTHTIRGIRKDERLPLVGETCHCYVDPRQKTMKLLGRWPLVKWDSIMIFKDGLRYRVFVNEAELSFTEKNRLAFQDGFRSHGEEFAFAEMTLFWQGRLPFEGHIIHWSRQ
jgi:hypothetical protein